MRTTLAIADDVLLAAKAIARDERRSVGDVLSTLARQALNEPLVPEYRNGLPILPRKPGGRIVTLEMVNALRDEEP